MARAISAMSLVACVVLVVTWAVVKLLGSWD